MGSLLEVCPVVRLLAIRHQANYLKAVVGRARILQAGGGGHGRLGLNYRNHTIERDAVASRILRKSDPLPTLGDIGSPLLPRFLSGEQLIVTVLIVDNDQTRTTAHRRIVPIEATVRGNLDVHGGGLRLIKSYHRKGRGSAP